MTIRIFHFLTGVCSLTTAGLSVAAVSQFSRDSDNKRVWDCCVAETVFGFCYVLACLKICCGGYKEAQTAELRGVKVVVGDSVDPEVIKLWQFMALYGLIMAIIDGVFLTSATGAFWNALVANIAVHVIRIVVGCVWASTGNCS